MTPEVCVETLVRVLSGSLTDDELAVLTAVLLARTAAGTNGVADPGRARCARWHRPERPAPYRSPSGWR